MVSTFFKRIKLKTRNVSCKDIIIILENGLIKDGAFTESIEQ